jgi:hypothetical protein
MGDDYNDGERDYTPGYTALLARGVDLLAPPASEILSAHCTRILALLDPGHAGDDA